MSNPSIADRNSTINYDGLNIECDGIQIGGVNVLSGQQDHIADVPTEGSADAAENADAINAILAALEAAGILADS